MSMDRAVGGNSCSVVDISGVSTMCKQWTGVLPVDACTCSCRPCIHRAASAPLRCTVLPVLGLAAHSGSESVLPVSTLVTCTDWSVLRQMVAWA